MADIEFQQPHDTVSISSRGPGFAVAYPLKFAVNVLAVGDGWYSVSLGNELEGVLGETYRERSGNRGLHGQWKRVE